MAKSARRGDGLSKEPSEHKVHALELRSSRRS